jgi:hypothetical protein
VPRVGRAFAKRDWTLVEYAQPESRLRSDVIGLAGLICHCMGIEYGADKSKQMIRFGIRHYFHDVSAGQTIKKNMESRKYLFRMAGWVAVWLSSQQGILMHERKEPRPARDGGRIVMSKFAAQCRLNGWTAA